MFFTLHFGMPYLAIILHLNPTAGQSSNINKTYIFRRTIEAIDKIDIPFIFFQNYDKHPVDYLGNAMRAGEGCTILNL